jgi:hypothetical protein
VLRTPDQMDSELISRSHLPPQPDTYTTTAYLLQHKEGRRCVANTFSSNGPQNRSPDHISRLTLKTPPLRSS